MSRRVRTALPVALLVLLLAAPLVMRYQSARSGAYGSGLLDDALERYGVFFEEVSEAVGIRFAHRAPELDGRLSHIMPQVASMGAGVSVVDFDRDGWNDLYYTNSGEGSYNALFHNRRDGTFEDVAMEYGVADVNSGGTGVSMGSVWGDYDNDGYEDLFLYKWGRPELYRNEGGTGFSRVTESSGLPAWLNANTAIWFDFDADGLLDLFVGGYYPETIDLWNIPHTRIMPESFEYAENGGRNFLFRNLGNGRFEDVAERVGLTSRRWALAAAATDLTGDGFPDLVIANDYGNDELYVNRSGRSFEEVGARARVGHAPKSGMNVAFGDILNEGVYAIHISNISEEGLLIQGNNLWLPRREGSGEVPLYDNLATSMGVELGGWSWSGQFGDLNNDAYMDLVLTNGYISADRSGDYWYDFTKIAGGNRAIISDAANWPDMKGRSLSGYQQKHLWLNDGAGRFREVAQAVGVKDLLDGRALALVDLWNRGVLDVVVANQRGPALVYRNAGVGSGNWIGFDLVGSSSNRSGIGARVSLYWGDHLQIQDVLGGSGYCSQNQRRLHFGLGGALTVDRAVVHWPSGQVQTIERPAINRLHPVREGVTSFAIN